MPADLETRSFTTRRTLWASLADDLPQPTKLRSNQCMEGNEKTVKNTEKCTHPKLRRDPPLSDDTPSTEENVEYLNSEADRLEALAAEKFDDARSENDAKERKALIKSARDTKKGAADKRFEAIVAKETNAKEVEVKIYCAVCDKLQGEIDIITRSGVHKEAKSSGKAVDPEQFYKECALCENPVIAPTKTIVHLAVPGDGRQRKKALNRFVRPGGRSMTNKGGGYNRLIQEH